MRVFASHYHTFEITRAYAFREEEILCIAPSPYTDLQTAWKRCALSISHGHVSSVNHLTIIFYHRCPSSKTVRIFTYAFAWKKNIRIIWRVNEIKFCDMKEERIFWSHLEIVESVSLKGSSIFEANFNF